MEQNAYDDINKQEKYHWWFLARRAIINDKLKLISSHKKLDILEIGCGTGGNLNMLKKYGNVFAMDMNPVAVNYTKQILNNVKEGSLPNNIPYERKFDIVCLFDVLEHIEEDRESIKVLSEYLKDEGFIILTVPAYDWLYSQHDKFLHHKRRYTLKEIELIFNDYDIKYKSYFNTLLFPLLLISRTFDKFLKKETSSGYDTPNNLINTILFNIFKIEKYFLKKFTFPYGASIMVIAKKKRV